MLNSKVTISIPFKHNFQWLDLSSKMWLAQSPVDEITLHILDTENNLLNCPDEYKWILNNERIEVAHLGMKTGKHHPSDPVAIAYDFSFSRCLSRYILTTHVDVFPRHRDVVKFMLEQTDGGTIPVVGWEASKRGFPAQMLSVFVSNCVDIPKEIWEVYDNFPSPMDGTIGMVCSVFDIAIMDQINLKWSLRSCHHLFGMSRGPTHSYGFPDTETASKFFFDKAGIRPKFLGRETNFENQETEHWIHSRSMTLELLPRHTAAFNQAKEIYDSWEIN